MERPYILHMFSPARQISPFDINMAADAGYNLVMPYGDVPLESIMALTQDTIFSRGPKGVSRTGIFIGGRDALLAMDMIDRAVQSMVPPFVVSVMTDPSGAFTTAAAMVACVEAALLKAGPDGLRGRRIVVLGGTGPVGRIAGVMAAQAGAQVLLSSREGEEAAEKAARQTGERFGVTLHGISGRGKDAIRASLTDADVVLGCAAAGVQVVAADDLPFARRLAVVGDVNAVPPEGIAGVGVMDDGKPVPGTAAVGYGALAIGNVKYQTHHRLLLRMRESDKPLVLGPTEAFEMARGLLAGRA